MAASLHHFHINCFFVIISIFVFYFIETSCGNCLNDNAVEFVEDKVYGCSGVWYNDGIDNAEYLCGNGFHICTSHIEASNLGLTKDLCTSTSILKDNEFFVSRQSSSGYVTCDDIGTDDLFGCGSVNNDGWLYFGTQDNTVNCGPFGATLSTISGREHAWKYGWEPWLCYILYPLTIII